MWKQKCPGCGEKINKKFNYCPYCRHSFKKQKEEDNFGMLGLDDFVSDMDAGLGNEIKLPLGLNKLMNSLMKQLEKELGGIEKEGRMPRGFSIQISSGKPRMRQINSQVDEEKIKIGKVSSEEIKRRSELPRVEAGSTIRRIGDTIVYELSTPGVDNKKDVIITKLEKSLEVKAYSKSKCYYKVIPLKVEILRWGVRDEKVVLELRG